MTVTGGGSTSQTITYSKVTPGNVGHLADVAALLRRLRIGDRSKPLQIQNVGDASGSYALSGIPSWVTIATGDQTGTVASGGSRTIQVGVSACPASSSTSSTHDQGTITVGGDGAGTSFDVSRTCDPPATTTLDLTIENVNSSTPWTSSPLRVQLYSDSGYTTQVASKTTSSGTVSFSGLTPATYYYKVFKPAGSGLLAEEYWGKGSADVTSDASVTFHRWMPYLDTSTLSITWDAAQNLFHVSVTARYPSASGSAYNLRLHGIADVNKASPWDGEATSSTASITAGGSATLNLDLTGGSGTNCFYFALQANEGGYLTTDQDGPWTTTRCQSVTPRYTLTVNVSGNGTVTSNPAGISCTTTARRTTTPAPPSPSPPRRTAVGSSPAGPVAPTAATAASP